MLAAKRAREVWRFGVMTLSDYGEGL